MHDASHGVFASGGLLTRLLVTSPCAFDLIHVYIIFAYILSVYWCVCVCVCVSSVMPAAAAFLPTATTAAFNCSNIYMPG
jgi:hypothetical protein